jgi:hypothetical protein
MRTGSLINVGPPKSRLAPARRPDARKDSAAYVSLSSYSVVKEHDGETPSSDTKSRHRRPRPSQAGIARLVAARPWRPGGARDSGLRRSEFHVTIHGEKTEARRHRQRRCRPRVTGYIGGHLAICQQPAGKNPRDLRPPSAALLTPQKPAMHEPRFACRALTLSPPAVKVASVLGVFAGAQPPGVEWGDKDASEGVDAARHYHARCRCRDD